MSFTKWALREVSAVAVAVSVALDLVKILSVKSHATRLISGFIVFVALFQRHVIPSVYLYLYALSHTLSLSLS